MCHNWNLEGSCGVGSGFGCVCMCGLLLVYSAAAEEVCEHFVCAEELWSVLLGFVCIVGAYRVVCEFMYFICVGCRIEVDIEWTVSTL